MDIINKHSYECEVWWVWPSWLGRQIVALKVMGSNPIIHPIYAGMAELADALDLGSSVIDVGVQVLFPAPCFPV